MLLFPTGDTLHVAHEMRCDYADDHQTGDEDGEGVGSVIQMLGIMVLTCFKILIEHDLLAPESVIKNIPVCSLILIELMTRNAIDFAGEHSNIRFIERLSGCVMRTRLSLKIM